MGEVLDILREASAPVLLLAILALGLLVRRLQRTNEAMREAESKRNADHLELMSKRFEEMERNDVRRQQSMQDGVARFKQLELADAANATALCAVAKEFVRVDTCRDCKAYTKEERDKSDRVQERFAAKLEAIEIALVRIEQAFEKRLETMTGLLAKVVKLGGDE